MRRGAARVPIFGRVYAHFGSYGTACLETGSGRVLWERRDLPCDHFRGPGSSPVFYQDLLILTMDGFDVQYLCALDKKCGKTIRKTGRSYEFGSLDGDIRKAYSTPIIFRAGGEAQMERRASGSRRRSAPRLRHRP